MKILLDPDVFFTREHDGVIPLEIGSLMKLLSENNYQALIYPLAKFDLNNAKRKKIILSKLDGYPILKKPPDPEDDTNFHKLIFSPQHDNDKNDEKLLYCVYRDVVDFLVTNNQSIVQKAVPLRLANRVFQVEEAIHFFQQQNQSIKIDAAPISIKEEFLYNINLDDPFFDTLKSDYNFEEWWKRKSFENKKAWVYKKDDKSIGAFLMLKEENEAVEDEGEKLLLAKPRLKISTLKVLYTGYRIGELFLKIAFEYAIKKNLSEIYLTCYPHRMLELEDLIGSYGFVKCAEKKDKEIIFLKKLYVDRPISKSNSFNYYYPLIIDSTEVNKFIIPIKPEFYERLFSDCKTHVPTLFEASGELIVEGIAIRKAYLCHSKIKLMKRGDVVLFYKTKTEQSVMSIGVVFKTYRDLSTLENVLKVVAKRTVYSSNEILEMLKKPLLVILFDHHFYFEKSIGLDALIENNIIKGAPQSIVKITDPGYNTIKKLGLLNERYTFNQA